MTARVEAWLRQEGFHSQACYHYSQAAEKALKGLLISLGTLPPYSHSLDRLAEEIRRQGVDITTFQDIHLKAISRMNSETRYPYDDEAPTDRFDEKDSAQARDVAQRVLAFVRTTLGKN